MRSVGGGWWLVVRLGCLGCAVAALSGHAQAQRRPEVLVSAASSLTEVMQRIAADYQTRTGTRVVLNFGASNTLARQIAAGAPVDLFISADEAQMTAIGRDILVATRVDLLSNQLAVAVPADRPQPVRSARDLADPVFKRIAIGDPAAVPAGVYARQYLERAGVWGQIERKIIPAGSVRLALSAVENGAADAAIVYRTDVASARRARLAFVVPAADAPRIVYPAAVLRAAPHADAAKLLLAFLRGSHAAAIFRAAGFIPLSAAGD
jgi:molybdate transport system substrate-binding protein